MVIAQSNTTFTPDAAIVIQGANNIQTLAVAERNLIEGTDNPDIIFGTPGNDEIRAKGGDDILLGTTGDDLLDGGSGFDSVDYSNLGQAITLLPRGAIGEGNSSGGQLQSIEKIVGAAGQQNTIDGSNSTGGASFDINLGANRLTVNNIPDIGSISFTVENFVNVKGTPFDDSIIGSGGGNTLDGFGGNDSLTGGLGNDTLLGGDGNDILQGTTDAPTVSSNEQDVLTGGSGSDRFILGNASGSFYKFAGDNDFAQITDFSSGDQIQLGTGDVYNVQRNDAGFDVFVVTNGVRDLIADVTVITGMGTATNTNTAGFLAASDTTAVSVLDTLPEGNFQLTSGQTLGNFVGA